MAVSPHRDAQCHRFPAPRSASGPTVRARASAGAAERRLRRKPTGVSQRARRRAGCDEVPGQRRECHDPRDAHDPVAADGDARQRTQHGDREDDHPPRPEAIRERGREHVAEDRRVREVLGDGEARVPLQRRMWCRQHAEAEPRERVADRDQVAQIPEAARAADRRQPERSDPAPAPTGQLHDDSGGKREHRHDEGQLHRHRKASRDGGHPGHPVTGPPPTISPVAPATPECSAGPLPSRSPTTYHHRGTRWQTLP